MPQCPHATDGGNEDGSAHHTHTTRGRLVWRCGELTAKPESAPGPIPYHQKSVVFCGTWCRSVAPDLRCDMLYIHSPEQITAFGTNRNQSA